MKTTNKFSPEVRERAVRESASIVPTTLRAVRAAPGSGLQPSPGNFETGGETCGAAIHVPRFLGRGPLAACMLAAALVATPALAGEAGAASATPAGIASLDVARRSTDEAAILALTESLLQMYRTEGPEALAMGERIYTPDGIEPPIIMDMGEQKGQPWAKSKRAWLQIAKEAIDTPLPYSSFKFELIEPKILVDQSLGTMVTRLSMGLEGRRRT